MIMITPWNSGAINRVSARLKLRFIFLEKYMYIFEHARTHSPVPNHKHKKTIQPDNVNIFGLSEKYHCSLEHWKW